MTLDDDLVARIRAAIRSELSPRHVPAVVVAVDDLPRTRSGKLVELAVADAVNGRAGAQPRGHRQPRGASTPSPVTPTWAAEPAGRGR